MSKLKYNQGDEVYWTDPDGGLSSGMYKIVSLLIEDEENSIWLISNGSSESEVFQHELSLKTIYNE